jgi:uncharacterized membrane protein YphA (DoxX/SURF4 family)
LVVRLEPPALLALRVVMAVPVVTHGLEQEPLVQLTLRLMVGVVVVVVL